MFHFSLPWCSTLPQVAPFCPTLLWLTYSFPANDLLKYFHKTNPHWILNNILHHSWALLQYVLEIACLVAWQTIWCSKLDAFTVADFTCIRICHIEKSRGCKKWKRYYYLRSAGFCSGCWQHFWPQPVFSKWLNLVLWKI